MMKYEDMPFVYDFHLFCKWEIEASLIEVNRQYEKRPLVTFPHNFMIIIFNSVALVSLSLFFSCASLNVYQK